MPYNQTDSESANNAVLDDISAKLDDINAKIIAADTDNVTAGGWVFQTNGNTITVSATTTTDIYTRSDGKVLTITYTDSTKATISSIARTA